MAERKKGATKAPELKPAAGARTFTIPKRPVFVLPEGVYDEVEAKAARWHALKAEIEKLTEEERAKQGKLGKLAEREVREGTSLEATMDKLQDEIAESRKARERAQLRLEPSLRAAWKAVLDARKRVLQVTRAFDDEVDVYTAALAAVIQAAHEATFVRSGYDMRQSEFGRFHVEEKFELPHVSPEFERGEPERAPVAPPRSGVIEYGPEVVVTSVEPGVRSRAPGVEPEGAPAPPSVVKHGTTSDEGNAWWNEQDLPGPVTHEDVERMEQEARAQREAGPERGDDPTGGEPGDVDNDDELEALLGTIGEKTEPDRNA
jgi:hypothetical protein